MTQDCHAALKTEVISDLKRKGFLVRKLRATDNTTAGTAEEGGNP